MSVRGRFTRVVSWFITGFVVTMTYAAVDLLMLKGHYLAQLPFEYAAPQFAHELWANWSLALAIGLLIGVIGFASSFAKEASPRKPRRAL